MTAWATYADPLLVTIDQAIHGQNYPDNRSIWHGVGEITFDEGGLSGTQWYQDNGPKGLLPERLEPRAFCSRGGCHFSFSGTGLIIRLNIAYAWYRFATLTIDGAAVTTSMLEGVEIAHALSCHAGDYPPSWEARGYLDLVVASELADAVHSVAIVADNADASKFFSIAGYKVIASEIQPFTKSPAWIINPTDDGIFAGNIITFTLANRGSLTVLDARLVFPAGLCTDTVDTPVTPQMRYGDPGLLQAGVWFHEPLAPPYAAIIRMFTSTMAGNTLSFEMAADQLNLEVQCSGGWGILGVYAEDNTTLLGSVDCGLDLGGAMHLYQLTGFGTDRRRIYLRKTAEDGKFVVFLYAYWTEQRILSVMGLGDEQLLPGVSVSQAVLPQFLGIEASDAFPYELTLTGKYRDPDGPITQAASVMLSADDPDLTFGSVDNLTPNGWARAYASDISAVGTIAFAGDTLEICVQRSGGWGVMGIYQSDGTTLIYTIDCGVNEGGQLHFDTHVGFGAGPHTVKFKKTVNDFKVIVFVRATWTETHTYTQIDETLLLTYVAQQPPPAEVTGVLIGDYDATFDEPDLVWSDYSGVIPRKNEGLQYTEVMTRFPTFAVCYQGGFFDILGEYDILIVDPIASHAADVAAWQARGIQVYGYVASGEEVGFYSNRYDFSSPLAANHGDGLGPGGYASYYMFTRYGTTGATWEGVWSEPDKNGVWASYYINPDPAFGWPDRLEEFYMPLVLGPPLVVVDEEVVTFSNGGRVVFDSAHAPFDMDQELVLKTLDGLTTFITYQDYSFDPKTGAVVVSNGAVAAGDHLRFSYTRKGLNCDGVFWDVVDTPDVYGSHSYEFGYAYVAGYDTLFIDMINSVKANHPDKLFISNRGFTILDSIIHSCSGVMFESYLTGATDIAHLATTDYYRITDPGAIAYNEGIHTQLRRLRESHVFDVFSLNYCLPDDTELQAYMRAEDEKHGYLSWQSTITLNTPAHNTTVDTPGPRHVSTAFTRYKTQAPRD